MTIKVLTCRAGDWCNSEGKPMDNYKLVPLEYVGNVDSINHIKGKLEEMIPKDAEVVTDYNPHFSVHLNQYGWATTYAYVLATALVPRNKAEETKDGDREQ